MIFLQKSNCYAMTLPATLQEQASSRVNISLAITSKWPKSVYAQGFHAAQVFVSPTDEKSI
jgi:hypothetical protein